MNNDTYVNPPADIMGKPAREITAHDDPNVAIFALDEPGPGGANHVYGLEADGHDRVANLIITFQKGAINEVGVNGVTIEALLAVCMDRLQAFQDGGFACRENANALLNIEQGMMWLHKRTRDRQRRGVEGKMKR